MGSADTGRPRESSRRGFALAAALFALLIIVALAAGAFAAARDESALGGNSRRAEQAFGAAEAGLGAAVSQGATGGWGRLRWGDSLVFVGALPSLTGRYTAAAVRLNGQLFLVRSAGRDASERLERRLALLARLEGSASGLSAAVAVGGPVTIDGSSFVDGRDADPPGWAGCPASGLDTVAGVGVGALDLVRLVGCPVGGCVAGRPPVLIVPVPGDSAGALLAGLRWDEMVRLADKTYAAADAGRPHTPAPSAAGSACDRDRLENWGEPARPALVASCTGYFPIIYAAGSFAFSGGRGEGVLLVQGDLTISGGAEFDGAVLVRGVVRTEGAGGRIRGALIVMGEGGGSSALEGALVSYSSCSIAASLEALAPVRALRERAWSEIR